MHNQALVEDAIGPPPIGTQSTALFQKSEDRVVQPARCSVRDREAVPETLTREGIGPQDKGHSAVAHIACEGGEFRCGEGPDARRGAPDQL